MRQRQTQTDAVDEAETFLNRYYADAVAELAQRYPTEQSSLHVSYDDLFRFDADLAERYLDHPDEVGESFDAALAEVDLPVPTDLKHATVRVTDLPPEHTYLPGDLTTDNTGYVGVTGDLERVTSKDEVPVEAAFKCERCRTMTYIPQPDDEFLEPHECQGCERQGPFRIVENRTEWDDFCRLRVGTPPEDAAATDAEHIDCYAIGDVVHYGGDHGLLGRAGDRVTVYGELERRQKDNDDGLFERVLRVRNVEFPNDDDVVDIAAHRERFEELAAREDAVDLLAESIAPALYATDAWETAMEWAVAYLFAAPKVELDDGTTYRGDIHGAIISDYGMGKSMFSQGLANLSPDCIRKSATGLASDVGLTAAAVQDDFGGDQWTLKPGVLVRANEHVILDEIDKGPNDLERINDAIEGQQQVDIEKAGLSATYSSEVGLLVMGNPKDGRFDPTAPLAEEIDVDSSLLSRFDGIVTMRDTVDEEIDAEVATQIGEGYAEANQVTYGDLDREDFDALDRPVDADVAQAWVQHARDEINPVFEKSLIDDIKKWYAEEVRQLNHMHGEDGGEDMPVPVTARVVMWVIRFSMAFARCHLRDRVVESDVERATTLAKRLVAQNWDGEQFTPEAAKPKTQKERKERIQDAVPLDNAVTPAEVADRANVTENVARNELENMAEAGRLARPSTGVYRRID